MQTLAKLILSAEKLATDPVSWFSNKPWIFKLVLIIVIVPLIGAQSIFWYEKITYTRNLAQEADLKNQIALLSEIKQNQMKFQSDQEHQLSDIKKDIAIFKEAYNTAFDPSVNGATEDVLGAQTAVVNENLRDRLQVSDQDVTIDTDLTQIYIKSDVKNISVFTQPSISSPKISNFDTTALYTALSEKGEWQQIDLGEGKSAWIEKKFVLKLPINEKP